MKRRYPILLAAMLGLSSLNALACGVENAAIPPSTPTSAFTLHPDGTVTHNATGLIWMRCSLGQTWNDPGCDGGASTYTWRAALDAVVEFNAPGGFNGEAGFAGHADWRLPNVKELESITEQRCRGPAVNGTVFPSTPDSFAWSSTPSLLNNSNAWVVSFNDNWMVQGNKLADFPVRLVRGGH